MTERPTAHDYADVFEVNKTGARVLEDLIARFAGQHGKPSGIDRILDTHEWAGRRQVLDFIAVQINRANGVEEGE